MLCPCQTACSKLEYRWHCLFRNRAVREELLAVVEALVKYSQHTVQAWKSNGSDTIEVLRLIEASSSALLNAGEEEVHTRCVA